MTTRSISAQEFKSLITKSQNTSDVIVVKQSVGSEVIGERSVKFTISTDSVDRDGDRINQKGWDLKSFKQNPVVLWGHNASEPPIGRVAQVGLEGGALKAIVEFVPETNPWVGQKAQGVMEMLKGGFLNACSVGFKAIDYEVSKDPSRSDGYNPGIDFNKQTLFELSICVLPSNPDALVERTFDLIDPADLPPEEIKSDPIVEVVEEVKTIDDIPLNKSSRIKRERILRLLKLTI